MYRVSQQISQAFAGRANAGRWHAVLDEDQARLFHSETLERRDRVQGFGRLIWRNRATRAPS